jgi:putative Ca2+/H+ antiporter (TMEM165/GDT1 family)
MGYALPALIPRAYTHYAACALFLIFGVRLLKDVLEGGEDSNQEELEEVRGDCLSFFIIGDGVFYFHVDYFLLVSGV